MPQIISITPNSGGVLQPINIVGRDEIIQNFWTILKLRGINLFAERRFGKSCVIRKMHHQTHTGFISIYKSVQGYNTPEQFVDVLYEFAKEHRLFSDGIKDTIGKTWNTISTRIPEAGSFKFSNTQTIWQKKLLYLIKQILASNPSDILVIFLDEFSLMLDEMKSTDAALVLGTLRDMVHDHFPTELRFVYTGSIGIDLILDRIKNDGHNLGAPLNHLEKKKLPPFNQEQAIYFCKCLEKGCNLSLAENVRAYIIQMSDGIPYFIDRIFDRIRYKISIDEATIDTELIEILNDSSDSNNIEHFYDRIREYYPDKELSHHILNIICQADEPISEKNIADKIQSILDRDRQNINEDLNRLWRDGYLTRIAKDGERHFIFQFRIIKQWWKINKAY